MSVLSTSLFSACSRLFNRYPLAVTQDAGDGGHRSMVVMDRNARSTRFFVLTEARDDLFVIRSWNRLGGVNQAIRPGEPVPGVIGQVITCGMPVPYDGALLGWVTDKQVTVMLAVHCRRPETWEDQTPLPEIWAMPMAGTSELLHWPPFTASPLANGRLWEYVEWGEIVDVGPRLTRCGGRAFWVPSPDRSGPRHGYIVVTADLRGVEYWLPAGVYADHWTLREGIPAPPAGYLLALPGAVDLALGRRWPRHVVS
jgi:hypothetical protein